MEESLQDIIRKSAIENNINNIDETYIFYYDESNNFRKMILREGGINAPLKHFSLGGILKKNKEPEETPYSLIKDLEIQKNSIEIKSKHIFQGDFPDMLKSKNLKKLLNNIIESDYYIHISILNPFYYSIVDIVDSVLSENEKLAPYHWEIKDFVYRALGGNKQIEIDLYNLEYPNIKNEELDNFKKLISTQLIKLYQECRNPLAKSIYEQFTDSLIKSSSLHFIQDNEDHILIKTLYHAYSHNTLLYRNSKHIFDNEKTIEPEFTKHKNLGKGVQDGNYQFKDSKELIELQISDVVAGLFGKYYAFLNENEPDILREIKENLSSSQKHCLRLMCDVIDKSDKESEGFFIE